MSDRQGPRDHPQGRWLEALLRAADVDLRPRDAARIDRFGDQQQRPRRSGLQGQGPAARDLRQGGPQERAALPGQRHLQRRRQGQGHRRSGAPLLDPGHLPRLQDRSLQRRLDGRGDRRDEPLHGGQRRSDAVRPVQHLRLQALLAHHVVPEVEQPSGRHQGFRGQRDRQELPELHHHRNLLERPDDRQDRGQARLHGPRHPHAAAAPREGDASAHRRPAHEHLRDGQGPLLVEHEPRHAARLLRPPLARGAQGCRGL